MSKPSLLILSWRNTHQLFDWPNIGLLCRTAVREKLKLEDIPASKAALSGCVAGFPSAVR